MGEIFNNTYSPLKSDANWLGLHKAGSHFASYISVSQGNSNSFVGLPSSFLKLLSFLYLELLI